MVVGEAKVDGAGDEEHERQAPMRRTQNRVRAFEEEGEAKLMPKKMAPELTRGRRNRVATAMTNAATRAQSSKKLQGRRN